MRVVVTERQLLAGGSCGVHLRAAAWNHAERALVYEDWEQHVERLLATDKTTDYLWWLVVRNLVPMTNEEFERRKAAKRAAA